MESRITALEFAELYAQYNLVARTMQKMLTKVGKLPLAQYYVLLMLSKSPQLRMGDISQVMSISRPNLTPLIDKLVIKGYVLREADAHDRRITYVSITETGRNVLNRENMAICKSIEKKLGHLSDTDLNTVVNSLNVLMQISEKV